MNSITEIGDFDSNLLAKSPRSSNWATVAVDVNSSTSVMSRAPSHSELYRISKRLGQEDLFKLGENGLGVAPDLVGRKSAPGLAFL